MHKLWDIYKGIKKNNIYQLKRISIRVIHDAPQPNWKELKGKEKKGKCKEIL